jgi:hypothetical protein
MADLAEGNSILLCTAQASRFTGYTVKLPYSLNFKECNSHLIICMAVAAAAAAAATVII